MATRTQVFPNATIQGGAADAFIIGGTTPAAGTFTDLAASDIDSTPIGQNTPAAGAFTTLECSDPSSDDHVGDRGYNDARYAGVDHDADHVHDGSDEIDGDVLDINYVPSNYTRTTDPSEVSSVEELTAHLGGIDNSLGLANASMQSLGLLVHPNNYGDLYRAGLFPSFFNQQWGGAYGGEYPKGVKADGTEAWFATGWIVHNAVRAAGYNTTYQYLTQGFKVSQAITVEAFWLKLYKVGNPQKDNEPFTFAIYSDSGGDPDAVITNGTANAINGHSVASASEPWPITDNTDG